MLTTEWRIKLDKLKKMLLNRETISYLIFGVLTTIIDIAAYVIFSKLFGINYLIANMMSWTIAVIFAFVTNKIYVFNSRNYSIKTLLDEIPSFVSARLITLIFSLVFIYMCVVLFGINDVVSKVASNVFVVILNYILSKFFIFSENKKRRTFFEYIKYNGVYIVSFIIPVIIMIIIYHARKIFPFGDEMYLRSDCYHQYAPFHRELYNKLINGGSLTYSWNIGMGVNFSALYAYYLASPINWFIAIFPEKYIIEVMNALIIIKAGLCSSTFAYYISNKFKSRNVSIAAFSIFYALSSYFAAFSWNVMWLDCLVLLPLVVLGLERLVKENKCFLYCLSLGLTILSNYYIGIMVCIFCVLYYAVLLYSDQNKKNLKYWIQRITNFGVYSLVAGGLATAVFFPAFYALKSTASGEFDFPDTWQNYFSILDMMSRSLINVEASIFSAHDPNLYCTVAVFILLPLYCMCSKINFKEKVSKVLLVILFLISFNTNVPNYIWHGFHFPNSLPCRESFIYIFLILTMCYEAFMNLKSFTVKQIMGSVAGAVALILVIEEMYVGDEYNFQIIYLSLIFILFYTIAFMLYRNDNYRRFVVIILILLLASTEAYTNLDKTGISSTSRSYYIDDNKDIEEVLDSLATNDKGFYRVEKYERHTKNDAAWNNYMGTSTFSSTASANLSEFYGQLGLEESTNAYAYYGHTPLTEALFSIKYVLSNSYLEDNDFIQLAAASGSIYAYENKYTLPLGYVINSDLEDLWDFDTTDPFAVQNSFVANALEADENAPSLYTRLEVNSDGSDAEVTMSEKTHLFIYVTTSLDQIDVEIRDEDGNSLSMDTYSDMNHTHTIDLGEIDEGCTVYVTPNDDEVTSLQLYAYSFDMDVFEEVFNKLNSQPFELIKREDTYVKGTVDAEESGRLLMSIPYDQGWTAYIDGEEAETSSLKGALLTIDIPQGKHTIELKYTPGGLHIGVALTSLSVITLICLAIVDFQKNKREKMKAQSIEEGNNTESTENKEKE